MGIRADLVTGLCSLLGAEGVCTWTPSGIVDVLADPPPVFRTIYPDAPDIAAALTAYATGGDEPTLSGSVLMLQVRTRSSLDDLGAAEDLDDAISQALMGNFPILLDTGCRVSVIIRVSSSPIGRDARGRMELSTNYRIMVHDPGPHRG
jgi:hypothetical protein